MATSIFGGSDEAYEFVCEPCERDNQYEKGAGYCVDCTEYMCSTCLICHKKSRPSRDHNLLDTTSIKQHGIPRKPPPLPAKPTKTKSTTTQSKPTKPAAAQQGNFTQKCKTHNDEFTKLYCNDHCALVCTVCMIKDHKQCKDVTYIPDVSSDVKQSTEFKNVFTELKRMHALLGFEHNRMLYNETTRIKEIHTSALGDLFTFKVEMVKAIDQMYARVEQELIALRDEQVSIMAGWLNSYKGLQVEVEKLILNVESNMSNGNYNQLFVDVKIAKAEMETLRQKSQRLSDDNNVTQYRFEGNNDIVEKLEATNGFGKIMKKTNPINVSAELLHEITVKSDKDANDCNIESALVLPDGDLALTDSRNHSVKIIDTMQKTVKTQIRLASEPYGIAVVEDNHLAVTLPADGKIQFLKLSNTSITKDRSISIEGRYSGIYYYDKKLIVVCQAECNSAPGCVHLLDMNGNILKQIEKDCLDRFLFTQPRCLALSVDKGALYLTEEKNKRVTLVNLNGEQIAYYQQPGHWEIRNALGVASDKDGTVYITQGDVHAIYWLSHVCSRPQKLLGEDDGLSWLPFAIALDRDRDLLYVGSTSTRFRNRICVIQLKYHWE